MRPLSGILRRVDRLSFPAMLVLGTGLGLGCSALTWLLGPVGLGLSAVVLLVGALVAMSAAVQLGLAAPSFSYQAMVSSS